MQELLQACKLSDSHRQFGEATKYSKTAQIGELHNF